MKGNGETMQYEFEKTFSELQKDMIAICLEYADYDVQKVFVYGADYNGMIGRAWFYQIDGEIYDRVEISKIPGKHYDSSRERQLGCMRILIEDLKKIRALGEKYNREMPIDMRLTYDAQTQRMDASYRYDVKGISPKRLKMYPLEEHKIWMEEERQKLSEQKNQKVEAEKTKPERKSFWERIKWKGEK